MKKFLCALLALILVLPLAGSASPMKKFANELYKNSTPPNEAGIAELLIKKGIVDKNAKPQVIETAVSDYIHKKLAPTSGKSNNKAAIIQEMQQNGIDQSQYGNLLHGRKLGNTVSDIDGIQEQPLGNNARQEKLLILLAEFGDDTDSTYGSGPLHNNIAKPQPENNSDFWVKDFSKDHYKGMLFTQGGYDAIDQNDKTLHLDSMVDYYTEQSVGNLKVEGDVYGWFTLPHSEAYYGDDDPDGGHDNRLPGTPSNLVADLLEAAKGSVPFEDYDTNGDGIIDHLVIVHAGVDQSGGGGVQGDNAIWAHSSAAFVTSPVDGKPIAQNYIIQGENGTIGVFCHEFAHDIGLPDEYDTIYSGNGEPVGFYSLMSSGSWTGKPLGTKPAPLSPWGRMALGWVSPTSINYNDITKDGIAVNLDQTASMGSNSQVIKVNLPKKQFNTVAPFSGTNEFFGGKGDEIDTTMKASIDLTGKKSASLDFWTFYDIEENWDFGFVQISEDNGATWKSLSSSRTTNSLVAEGYPAIRENLPGYTGNSGGWVNEKIDLTPYAGKNIMLQFRYMTDWGTSLSGFYVDDIKVIADGNVIFTDGAENGSANWSLNGWTISKGSEMKSHYYLLEWRNPVKADEALNYGYNFVNYDAGFVQYFKHDPGLLVWYRDTSYADNWVGVHPGHGFLGIVDAHSTPIVIDGSAVRTRIQIHDAVFNMDRGEDKTLTIFGKAKTLQSEQAVPEFNDSQSYWNPKAPSTGIIIPTYGLKFRVTGHSADNTVGRVIIYK